MINKITLYQKTRTGKTQQWTIWIDPIGKNKLPEIWIEHGLLNGKKQTTNDIVSKGVNIGKVNETTPLQQAILMAERKIKKQKEKGYVENIKDLKKNLSISFYERLPKELCFYKPKNSIDNNKIQWLEKEKRAVYTIKRDGMMHIVRKTKEFGVEIYSRRMDLVSDKYPHLIKAFNNLDNNTILLGEVILINNEGKDNFNGVSQICRSDPQKALEKQNELGKVTYYIFDMAYFMGKNLLISDTFESRQTKIAAELWNKNIDLSYIMPLSKLNMSHRKALNFVKKSGFEGLVVWDSKSKMKKDEAFTLNGKAYRPNLLWKSKPKYEDDFIVKFNPRDNIGEYGTGKNKGKVRSVCLYQIKDGEEIFLGRCGGGLSDEQRTFYTKAEYPRVWRVEYDSIQPKTGSLRFPVFNADRTLIGDKLINECLMSDEIVKAREIKDE